MIDLSHHPELIFGYRSVDVFLLLFALIGAAIHFTGWILIIAGHQWVGVCLVGIGILVAIHAPMSLSFDFVPFSGWWHAMLDPTS
jgi:hypothetical protein